MKSIIYNIRLHIKCFHEGFLHNKQLPPLGKCSLINYTIILLYNIYIYIFFVFNFPYGLIVITNWETGQLRMVHVM